MKLDSARERLHRKEQPIASTPSAGPAAASRLEPQTQAFLSRRPRDEHNVAFWRALEVSK